MYFTHVQFDLVHNSFPLIVVFLVINGHAIISPVHFGKGVLGEKGKVKVNTVLDPTLVKYYKKGAWDVY